MEIASKLFGLIYFYYISVELDQIILKPNISQLSWANWEQNPIRKSVRITECPNSTGERLG